MNIHSFIHLIFVSLYFTIVACQIGFIVTQPYTYYNDLILNTYLFFIFKYFKIL